MDATSELDVIPVMSLIVHLVPMLLLSVRFLSLGQVTAQGPVVPAVPASGTEQLARQAAEVVSVRITGEGFVVGGLPEGEPRIPCSAPCGPGDYDYVALNASMAAAKRAHPEEGRVVIVPEPAVPYDVIVRVMEAARARETDGGEIPLFPVPILAVGSEEAP